MISTEDVLFIMPRDREMQFCAMSALQRYVNDYVVKMEANCVTLDKPEYRMRYWAEMPDDEWNFFKRLGIDLKQDRQRIGFPDSVVELTDERLLSFFGSDKHCSQICAAIAGVEAPPFPKIKVAMCGEWSGAISVFERLPITSDNLPADAFVHDVTIEELMRYPVVDGTSILAPIIVGRQSWQTYAAASMALPVIEILPKGRGVNWLSKWKSALYRMIEEDRLDRLPDAIHSIREVLKWRCSQVQAGKAAETKTALGESIAPNADSTSLTPTSL